MNGPLVGVHGIKCYRYYEEAGSVPGAAAAMSESWTEALARGASAARVTPASRIDVAYYAHLLHKATAQGPATDLRWLDADEQALLMDVLRDLGAPAQVAHGPRTVPIRQAAQWLASRFGPVAVGSVALFCREVQAYLGAAGSTTRAAVRDAVADAIATARPRAVVAHSLGSVVAYETLWGHPELEVDLLLTIGSPLGMRHVVRNRLTPSPDPATGRGARPPGVATWINIADRGDIVAATGSLADSFDGVNQQPDITIDPVAFHTAIAYLSHPEVAARLAGR